MLACKDNCDGNEDFHAVPFRSAEYPLVQSPYGARLVVDVAAEYAMPILISLPAATTAIAAYIGIVVFTMSGNAQSRQLLIVLRHLISCAWNSPNYLGSISNRIQRNAV